MGRIGSDANADDGKMIEIVIPFHLSFDVFQYALILLVARCSPFILSFFILPNLRYQSPSRTKSMAL